MNKFRNVVLAVTVTTLSLLGSVSFAKGGSAWAAYDLNKDGSLSRDEVNQAVNMLFDSMDSNKDGRLDGDELGSTKREKQNKQG